jgi:glycosyltransferase involved in cell wall biosynthesis
MGPTLVDEVRRYGILAQALAKNESFDVIHAHDWLSYLAGIEAKRVSGKPLIVHVHATEFDRTGSGSVNQQVYDIERAGMQAADTVIAVSAYTKQVVIDRYGISPDKIEVVHNGIDFDDCAYAQASNELMQALRESGNRIVLFVGRITLQKGPDYFIELAKRVSDLRPNTVFVIVGSGDMQGQIAAQAAQAGIAHRVFFIGFLRGEELGKAYRAADVLVMPSVSEPFGIVPLESLVNGTPVLISKQSGVSEVLRHALKVDFWDINEMVNQLVSVLDHKSLQTCLSENGEREARGQVWDRAAQTCAGIYKKVYSFFAP